MATETEKAILRSKAAHADRICRKLARKAGPAEDDREAVSERLSDAIDVFATEPTSNLTLTEIARAGHRIGRLAEQLRAADRLPAARMALEKCRGELEAAS